MDTQANIDRRKGLHGKRWELDKGIGGTFEYHPVRKNFSECDSYHVLLLRLDAGGVWVVTGSTVEREAAEHYGAP